MRGYGLEFGGVAIALRLVYTKGTAVQILVLDGLTSPRQDTLLATVINQVKRPAY